MSLGHLQTAVTGHQLAVASGFQPILEKCFTHLYTLFRLGVAVDVVVIKFSSKTTGNYHEVTVRFGVPTIIAKPMFFMSLHLCLRLSLGYIVAPCCACLQMFVASAHPVPFVSKGPATHRVVRREQNTLHLSMKNFHVAAMAMMDQ